MGDGVVDALCHFVLRQVRNGAVQGRCADEGVDARSFGMAHRLPAAVDVPVVCAGEAADHRVLGTFGDLADRFEVAFGSDWEAGLDDVDAHVVEKLGNFQLFVMAHGRARRLFAVAQGGVKDHHAVLVGCHVLIPCPQRSVRRAIPSERSRRKARSEAAKEKKKAGARIGACKEDILGLVHGAGR